MSNGSGVAGDSGFTPGHTLPPGTVLRDYRIDAVLGEGGFGVVYLALDTALERRVAIKEYLPAGMASRTRDSLAVSVKAPGHAETFAAGLRSFVNEARLLARFDHAALVKVHQFWEQNGTAYMVMPYYEGPTLKRTLSALGRTPTEAELRAWLMPLLDALSVLHAERCYHRDIAPDNILITANGPLLLDFGAARRVIGEKTQALTAVLKPGFAPIEQYGDVPGMSQGAWTDIFALASVLYVALAGVKPMSSIERVMDDRLQPLSRLAAGRASTAFLSAIDDALALLPADRPQTVAEFLARLDGKADAGRAAATPAQAVPQRAGTAPQRSASAETTVEVDLGFEAMVPAPRASAVDATAPSALAVEGGRRHALALTVLGGGALVAGAAAWLWIGRGREPVETTAPVAPPPVAPAPAPQPPPAQASVPPPDPAPTPPPAPAPATPPPPPDPAPAAAPPPQQAAPTRPARTAPRAADKPVTERPPAARRNPANEARCSDILQRASLEPLSASDAEFLKRECR